LAGGKKPKLASSLGRKKRGRELEAKFTQRGVIIRGKGEAGVGFRGGWSRVRGPRKTRTRRGASVVGRN